MNQGHLFKWIEDAICEEVEDVIPKLEIIDKEISTTITEVDELKALIEELKEDIARSKMEIKKEDVARSMEIKKWKALMMLGFVVTCIVSVW